MKIFTAIIYGIIALGPCAGTAAIGVDWRTPYAGMTRTNYLLDCEVKPPFALAWEYENDLSLQGAALVSHGLGFFCSSNLQYFSVNLEDGELIWKHNEARAVNELRGYDALTGDKLWDRFLDGDIIHAPQVAQPYIYVSTNANILYAIRQLSGDLLWQAQFDDALTLPAADKDMVVVGSGSKIKGLSAADGSAIFTIDLGKTVKWMPAISNDDIWVISGTDLVKITREGKLGYRADVEQEATTPLAVTSSGVLVGTADGRILMFSRSGGEISWEYILAGTPMAIAGSGDVVFVGSKEGVLTGLHMADGSQLWATDISRGPISGIALAKGMLVVNAGNWAGALIPAPEPPSELSLDKEKGQVILNWYDAKSNGSPIERYCVYRRNNAGLVQIAQIPFGSHTYVEEKFPGKAAYAVSAVGANGAESPLSAEVNFDEKESLIQRVRIVTGRVGEGVAVLSVYFHLREAARIVWNIMDEEGMLLTIEEPVMYPKGPVALAWNGTDTFGDKVMTGVYRLNISAIAGDNRDLFAKAFPVNWSMDGNLGDGLAGPVASSYPVASVSSPISGAIFPPASPGSEDPTLPTEDPTGNNGVRDHGHGLGRDDSGEGKAKGHPHADTK